MTPEEDLLKEKSLLRCIVKKMLSMAGKHIPYASYVVVAYLVITGILIAAIALARSIAWYWYAGAGIIVSYAGYAYLWCVARELTDEDWNSNEAEFIVELLALLGLGLGLVLWLLGLVLGLVLVLMLGLGLWLVLMLGLWLEKTRVFLFLGAYLHYRKRMKNSNGK